MRYIMLITCCNWCKQFISWAQSALHFKIWFFKNSNYPDFEQKKPDFDSMKAPTDILGRNTSRTSFLFEKEDVLEQKIAYCGKNWPKALFTHLFAFFIEIIMGSLSSTFWTFFFLGRGRRCAFENKNICETVSPLHSPNSN